MPLKTTADTVTVNYMLEHFLYSGNGNLDYLRLTMGQKNKSIHPH